MKIKWNFNSGYVTRIPDFIVEVPDNDLKNLPEDEQDKVIDAYVRTEFENRITYYWERKAK